MKSEDETGLSKHPDRAVIDHYRRQYRVLTILQFISISLVVWLGLYTVGKWDELNLKVRDVQISTRDVQTNTTNLHEIREALKDAGIYPKPVPMSQPRQ